MANKKYVFVEGAQSQPARYGIINSETLVTLDEDRWEGGISVESESCNTTTKIVEVCDPTHEVVTSEASSVDNCYSPFVIQTILEDTTRSNLVSDYFDSARKAMEVCQGKAIEHELWTGALAQQDEDETSDGVLTNVSRYLASSEAVNVTPTPGTAVNPAYGLALLEDALASCGCGARGVVHATRGVSSALKVIRKDDYLETKLGTQVISGVGYDGSGPDGEIPSGTVAWMYATGPVSVHLGDISTTPSILSEAIDTRNNTVRVSAERSAAVTWDGCCHFAVLVDLSLDY